MATVYSNSSNATKVSSSSSTGINTGINQYTDWDNFVEDTGEDAVSTYGNGTRQFAALTNSITGIFGIPYQWPKNVDMPISSTGSSEDGRYVGRQYMDKILSTMPILFLTPGLAKFMPNSSGKNLTSVGQNLVNFLGGDGDNSDDAGVNSETRYYSFQSEFNLYKEYANMSCRILISFLGLQDKRIPIPGTRKTVIGKRFNIEKFMNNDFTRLFGSDYTLPFFIDSETSISEDFSNSTTESMLAQTANGFSSAAREVQFILGEDGENRTKLTAALSGGADALASVIGNLAGGLSDVFAGKNMVTRISNQLTTIVKGGKIIFPEIWSDSSYSRSYNISLKFRSPDPDPVSIFLNVYLPILLLIDMAAPRQLNNSANAYESPFLVRALYKSVFTCDMGIIESISITRGGDEKWNVMGMPLAADVTLSLKDLYGSMFISRGMGIINNTIQMDYLATLAGVDMNEWEPFRIWKLAIYITTNTIEDIPSRIWGGIKQTANRAVANIYGRIGIDTRALRGY